MREIKKGTTFFVCSRETLIEKGWKYDQGVFVHSEYLGNSITDFMLNEYESKILTVEGDISYKNQKSWYFVRENYYYWPVATFFAEDENLLSEHTCTEGMTPINGWFICKTCGDNLREIK